MDEVFVVNRSLERVLDTMNTAASSLGYRAQLVALLADPRTPPALKAAAERGISAVDAQTALQIHAHCDALEDLYEGIDE